jgi:hypothetical protein
MVPCLDRENDFSIREPVSVQVPLEPSVLKLARPVEEGAVAVVNVWIKPAVDQEEQLA